MKILEVSHYFASNGGGIEIIVDRLREGFTRQGHEVRWIAAEARTATTSSYPASPYAIGIRSWDGIRSASDLAFPLFGPFAIPRIMREVRHADIIHLHEAFYPLHQLVMYGAVLLRRPVVITQHIADMPIQGFLRGRAVALANVFLTRPAFALARHIVFYSRRTEHHFRKWAWGKHTFLHNGCDGANFRTPSAGQREAARRSLGATGNPTIALFVGRFIEKKGIHKILSVARTRRDFEFWFVGHGPLSPDSASLPNVRVFGPQTHHRLPEFYHAADCLVLPSIGEGMPLVVQEALCTGLPCVVSREIILACPEIEPWVHGAGDEGKNLETALADCTAVSRDPVRRQERSDFARSLWSWNHCACGYLRIFEDVVGRRRQQRGLHD